MEKVSCNLCGSKKHKVYLKHLKSPEFNEEFTLVKCNNCNLVYLNPRPTKREIGKYYLTTDYFSDTSNAKTEYSLLYDMVFENIKKGRVFDIGSGTGLFLTEFKKRKWDIDGTEPSASARKVAKTKFGINLKKSDFLDLDFKNRMYDLVTLNNVIEHLHEPKETIQKASSVVDKGGFILISCPNIGGIGPLIFRRKWYGMDVPRHLYQFSPETIKILLEDCGFKIVKTSHGFYRHNYLVLFESFRRSLSPRFSENKQTEISPVKPQINPVKSKQSLIKRGGIFISKLLSALIAFSEPFVGRGEIVTILARGN